MSKRGKFQSLATKLFNKFGDIIIPDGALRSRSDDSYDVATGRVVEKFNPRTVSPLRYVEDTLQRQDIAAVPEANLVILIEGVNLPGDFVIAVEDVFVTGTPTVGSASWPAGTHATVRSWSTDPARAHYRLVCQV